MKTHWGYQIFKNMKEKETIRTLVVVVKWRHLVNGLFSQPSSVYSLASMQRREKVFYWKNVKWYYFTEIFGLFINNNGEFLYFK